MKKIDFIEKYPELFDGEILNITKIRTYVDYYFASNEKEKFITYIKDIRNFLGAHHYTYNPEFMWKMMKKYNSSNLYIVKDSEYRKWKIEKILNIKNEKK